MPMMRSVDTTAANAKVCERHQRYDTEHVACKQAAREPSGLRAVKRPVFDKLRQERRHNGVARQPEDFGGADGKDASC